MFKKPLDQRFRDTYQFIHNQIGGVDAAAASALIETRTRALAAAGDLTALVELMSLGFRWTISKSASETRRRHYVRAVLMGYATFGDPDSRGRRLSLAEIKARKSATEKRSEQDLHALLQRMLQQTKQTDGQRTYVGFDTSLEKQNAAWAMDKITEAVTRAQWALGMIGRNPEQAALFTTWFGASDPKTLRDNFGRILRGIANGIILIKDDDPANDNVFGYVYPDGDNDPPRIYLCNAFWRAGKVQWNAKTHVRKDGRDGFDNPLGVLLHELSHIFVRTEDYTYGKPNCRQLAQQNPAMAAMNADNYEYYAESIMGAR